MVKVYARRIHQSCMLAWKDIAPALCGNPTLFDLAENLRKCRECHKGQLGQKSVGHFVWPVRVKRWAFSCVQMEWERERNPSQSQRPFSFSRFFQERSSLILCREPTAVVKEPWVYQYQNTNYQPIIPPVDFNIEQDLTCVIAVSPYQCLMYSWIWIYIVSILSLKTEQHSSRK
jgi:hypothetical protein